jgi:hypothetical protein
MKGREGNGNGVMTEKNDRANEVGESALGGGETQTNSMNEINSIFSR